MGGGAFLGVYMVNTYIWFQVALLSPYTPYFSSKQLLLFAVQRQTAVTAYL